MRVGLALGSSGPGGAEKLLLDLAVALRARGDEPRVYTLRPGWMTERAAGLGLPVDVVPQRGLDPLWVPRFAARLRRDGVEVLHTHEFDMNVYGGAAARLARRGTLATIHGHAWIGEAPRRARAYRVLHRLGMEIATVSDELAGFLAGTLGLPVEAIGVVHNGIPVSDAPPDAARRPAARAEAGLPPDGPLVLAVGNLYPVKDHATLLRALARLPGGDGVRVAIAGRGGEEPALRALAHELGVADRVHLLGVRDDVARLLQAADLVAHPSREEGLPMAILEAMAAARAVVASDVGGIGEALVDGESGLLVPARDPDALARALGALLADPARAERLGRAAHARARAEFSVEQMTARYRERYARLRPRARSSASTSA